MIAGIPKKVLRKYLYEFRVPLRWPKVKKVVEDSIAHLDDGPAPQATAHELLAIKRALEAYRKREGITTKQSVAAESSLLEAAAETGDPAAVALLCGVRFDNPEDRQSGSKLLRQLMDMKFPLAFKVSGDLAFKLGQQIEAAKFWKLALDGLEDARLRVECWRGIGHVAFRTTQLFEARSAFTNACKESEKIDPRQTADCHFFLAQLREPDRLAARTHLETAAGYGLSDAFVPLGSLLLNFFGEAALARHWFELALATDQSGAAAIGLLDCAIRLKDKKLANQTIRRIARRKDGAQLLASRQITYQEPVPQPQAVQKDRWDF